MSRGSTGGDVLLQPGDCYFGGAHTRVRTLLGSCVAIAMWHPQKRIGGLSHCLLPQRDTRVCVAPDGRFVDESLLWLIREAVRADTNPADYRIKVFGGGDMFASLRGQGRARIGRMNSTMAVGVICGLGLTIAARDVGGCGHRSLIFSIATGHVWVRKGSSQTPVQGGQGVAA